MLKTAIYTLALLGVLGGGLAASQAREIKVWGQTLTVDDQASAPVFAAPRRDFNAVVTDRDHYPMRFHRFDGSQR